MREKFFLKTVKNKIKLDVLNLLIFSLKYETLGVFFKLESYASSKVSSWSIGKGLTTIHGSVLSRSLEV